MLILFTSDLHGKRILYEELIKIVAKVKPDILILGGDLLPKLDKGEDLFLIQRSFIKQYFLSFFNRLRQKHSLDIVIMLGNDDFLSLREELSCKEHSNWFHLIDNSKWVTRSDWEIVAFNLIPETPFPLKDLERRDCVDDGVLYPSVYAVSSVTNGYRVINAREWLLINRSLSEELATLPHMPNPERTIFVSHAPPYGTTLDVMSNGIHVGSKAIRTYIETNQPLISLNGHIHESFFMTGSYITRIGRSICIGPGQIHYPKLDAVFFDIDDPIPSIRHTCESDPVNHEGRELLKAPFCSLFEK